ncbi:MAG: hypothetical protein WD065_05835 [Planctomycetaceae bacterium]
MAKISKTQIDKLGERLKAEPVSDTDITLLDEYRRSFGESFDFVEGTMQNQLGLTPSGRRAKTTASIIDKLCRESIRLSQIQDIAGCRLIVSDVFEQDRTVFRLQSVFPSCAVIDRRSKPSHGYRAVHVIVKNFDCWVEIQIRTSLQHLWAQISETLSDTFDPTIKYGGGSDAIQSILTESSAIVAALEESESQWSQSTENSLVVQEELEKFRNLKEHTSTIFAKMIEIIESQ